MRKKVLVYLNKKLKDHLFIQETTTIKDIKEYLEKFGNVKVRMLINTKQEMSPFNTKEYDDLTLKSIWKNIKKPEIYLTSYLDVKMDERTLTKNKDVDKLILAKLDDKSLLNFCLTSKYGNQLCQDENFWLDRINSRYPLLKEFKPNYETWRQFFTRMTYYIAKLDEEFGIPYIPNKDYNPEEFYKRWNNSKYIYNTAMLKAALGGHTDIIKYLIDEKGARNFNETMASAARGGHTDIIKYLIDEKGANDFNEAMASAAEGGHIDIVKSMIEKGEVIGQEMDFDDAMGWAAYRNHLDIVNLMIDEKGARDFNTAMARAARSGHMEMVKYLIEKGARYFNGAMKEAVIGGHLDIVKLMIEKAAERNQWLNFYDAKKYAAYKGHTEIVNYLKQFI